MKSIEAQVKGVTDSELSKERLLEEYLIGDNLTIYTIARGSSASGLTHYISLFCVALDNTGKPALYNITYHASKVLGDKITDRDGHRAIKVQGGNMDMGFHLVYSLSSVLYAGQDRAGYVLSHRAI